MPTRFPYNVKCNVFSWSTGFVKLPGIAVKLWSKRKRPKGGNAKQ